MDPESLLAIPELHGIPGNSWEFLVIPDPEPALAIPEFPVIPDPESVLAIPEFLGILGNTQ